MASINDGFKFTQNQLNEVDLGLAVTTVSDPNRVVITNVSGYLQVSDITYSQLQELVLGGGGGITTADNGLTKVGNTAKLGGELLVDTVLFNNNNNPFSFSISLTDSAIENSQSAITVWREEGNFGINLDASNDLFGSNIELSSQEANMVFLDRTSNLSTDLIFSPTGNSFTDDRLQKGLRYGGNYFTNNTGVNYNPRWIPDLGYISTEFAPALGSGSYIQNQTASAQSASFRINGTGQLQGGGEVLKIGTNTGNPDYVYMGFYARTASPTIKTGEIGHAGFAGTTSFVISNLINGGPLGLVTTGAGGNIQCSGDYISIQSSFATGYNSKLGYHASTQYAGLEQVTHLGSYANGSQVLLRTSSGTGTVGVTANNNSIGRLVFSGFNLTNGAYDSASIKGVATETWSSTAGGSKIDIHTTPNGTITQSLAVTIDQDQSLLYKYASKSVDPTATEIPTGCVKVYLNTTSGVLKMWANQAGVLKSITLA